LHTNGELIFKRFRPENDSPFVRRVWALDLEDRGTAWLLVIEALALGARRERIDELAAKWGLTDDDALRFVDQAKANGKPAFRLFRDGDQWCATFGDFVNVQESQCGFGTIALDALAELARPGLMEKIL
jgi:hypothetical protein